MKHPGGAAAAVALLITILDNQETPMKWERVRTDAGWHGRIRYGGNHEPAWVTEVVETPEAVTVAFERLAEFMDTQPSSTYALASVLEVDERTAVAQLLAHTHPVPDNPGLVVTMPGCPACEATAEPT